MKNKLIASLGNPPKFEVQFRTEIIPLEVKKQVAELNMTQLRALSLHISELRQEKRMLARVQRDKLTNIHKR